MKVVKFSYILIAVALGMAGELWMGSQAVGESIIHPENYSFEYPVLDNLTLDPFWPEDPGLNTGSPNWKTSGGAYIFRPSPVQIYPLDWCPAPTQGLQILGYISVGATVYQLLPARFQMGKTYTLRADAGDANVGDMPSLYHPTAVLTLCAGTTDDPANWDNLSTYSLTLNNNGSTFTLSTSYAVTPSNYATVAGKRLGVKLTYAQPTPPQQSTNYDLTWDNVSIAVSPDIKAETGWVMINGARTMPMGWMGAYPTEAYPPYQSAPLEEGECHGFDFVMPYSLLGGVDTSPEGLQAYLDNATKKGVKIVADLRMMSEEEVREWVNRLKDNITIYGYYLADEPDLNNRDHGELKTLYDTVKALDPNRPVLVVFGRGLTYDNLTDNTYLNGRNRYIDCTDIVLIEVLNDVNQGRKPLVVVPDPGYNNVSSSAMVCQEAGKSYMIVPYPGLLPDQPYPDASVFRFWVFGSIAAGAGGIMQYIFEGDPEEPNDPSGDWKAKRNEVVYPTTDLLKIISPVLLKGKQGLTVTDNIPTRSGRTFKDGYARLAGDAYDAVLVGVYTNTDNTSDNVSIIFTITGLDSNITTGTVLGENRTVTLNGGSFTDTFNPMGVHVYRFTRCINPSNYSFESPALSEGTYWPDDPGLNTSSPDWKTSGVAYIAHPTAYQMGIWCPPPTDGHQSSAWIGVGTTVYQQLSNQIQSGVSYILTADAGDGGMISTEYHPTARLSLCACNDDDPVGTWTVLSERVQTLNGYLKTFPLSTPAYTGTGTMVGKYLAIKLTYDSPSQGQYSYNYDLTWDNVRVAVRPSSTTAVATSVADTQLVGNASTTNYGTGYYMQTDGYTSGPIRSLIKFDLPSLPVGNSVVSATLGIYAYNGTVGYYDNGTWHPPIPNTTHVHKVLTDWQETSVTWANFNSGGQPGTDYATSSLFFQTLSFDNVSYQNCGVGWGWLTGDVTSAVRDWYAAPTSNRGFILISDNSTEANYLSLFTRETSYSDKVPYLSVTYGPTP